MLTAVEKSIIFFIKVFVNELCKSIKRNVFNNCIKSHIHDSNTFSRAQPMSHFYLGCIHINFTIKNIYKKKKFMNKINLNDLEHDVIDKCA